MNTISLTTLFFVFLFVIGCNEQSKNAKEGELQSATTEQVKSEITANGISNIDSLVSLIDAKRSTIEQRITNPFVLSTQGLREKTKQKWEKIHFYSIDGEVVRIKTYPYSQISKRTEEFYLEKGSVILAVIEDDGSAERGSKEAVDKMYYYMNNELIKEKHNNKEKEFTIKYSEAEELLQEVAEYLDIYKEQSKK